MMLAKIRFWVKSQNDDGSFVIDISLLNDKDLMVKGLYVGWFNVGGEISFKLGTHTIKFEVLGRDNTSLFANFTMFDKVNSSHKDMGMKWLIVGDKLDIGGVTYDEAA